MPSIDVVDVLASLDIACQTFSVVRRVEIVNSHGRSTLTPFLFDGVIGAVQPAGDNSLVREDAYTQSQAAISVWTAFRIYDVSRIVGGNTFQPDLILFGGNYYIVKAMNDWTQFGQGFVQADCIGIDYVNIPTGFVPVTSDNRLDFSNPANSQYLPGLI